MASLIKTNKLSTPGGEEFTLPTTYPSATVDLTSTSGGQLGYGPANPITANAATSTGKIAERFCDKLRVNNANGTVANATLNALPSDVTDVSSIVRTQIDFSGVCFTGTGNPYVQLLDASNNNVINGNYYVYERKHENYGGGSTGTLNTSPGQNNASTNGLQLNYNQTTKGAAQSGEIFAKTSNVDNLTMMSGYIIINQYNIQDGLTNNSMLIESNIQYNYNGTYTDSGRTCMVHKWTRYCGQNTIDTFQPYTQVKIYDLSGNAINEGMFVSYSHINVNK